MWSVDDIEANTVELAAPGRVLGEFPAEPRIRRDLLIAVTSGDLTAETDRIDQCLREHYAVKKTLEIVPQQTSVAPIEFWLDLPGTPSWMHFGRIDDQVYFLIHGRLALALAGGSAIGG